MSNSASPASDASSLRSTTDDSPPFKKRRTSSTSSYPELSRVLVSKSKPKSKPTSPPPTIAAARKPSALKSPTSFATLNVSPWLLASLNSLSIKRPTAIQAACIPPLLRRCNCLGGAQTGSGKTLAFAVPILQLWAQDPTGVFAVVLTPTRELAVQIYEQFNALGSPHRIKCLLVTGGADMLSQATGLSARPHVVVATPGRLAEHVRTSGAETVAGLRRVRFIVLDEADRLLAPGPGSMLGDVEECLGAVPEKGRRQTCLFTATVTEEVRALREGAKGEREGREMFVAELGVGDGEERKVVRALPEKLEQTYLLTPTTHREAYLHILLSTARNVEKSTIIFVNRTTTAQLLEHMLRLLEHRVTSLHSLLPQRERSANLAKFRARAVKILVATDVASRGLDIPDVALIVNYDVPRDPDDYVHRVGRTARAGKRGMSVTFVGQRDVELVHAIENRTGSNMVEFEEEGVSVETRVVRDGLKPVGEKKREAMLQIERGMNVKGKRKRMKLKPAT